MKTNYITRPRANPTAVSIGLNGYVAKVVYGNIKNWSLSALADNPNIIEQIAGTSKPSYTGGIMPWYDEFPGKLLTGIAFNYAIAPTDELLRAGNDLANALRDSQKADGYLGIYAGDLIFGGQGRNWDVWGHYHMIYGLLLWHRVTGNPAPLDTAVRALDCVYRYFIEGNRTFDSAGEQTMNLGISHVFAEMYKQTGDRRYLDTAVQIVEEDWPRSGNWMNNAFAGLDYYQSSLPRWEALHTVLTLGTLYEITGTEKYFTALGDIWQSIAKTDRHNTGGFTSGEAACGDPYNTGAIESCCTIAWMALTSEYLQLTRNSLVADEEELSWYNGMLGSLLDGERYVTYNTPMEGGKRVPSQVDIAFQYNSGSPDFNCCQANVSRGLGELSQWAVLTDEDTVYVNYYGDGPMNAKTPNGQTVVLTQATRYPTDGTVRVTVDGLADEETFTLALRIPVWADGSTVTVDGVTHAAVSGDYFRLERTWKNGDVIELVIGMTFHAWVNENDPATASVYYGPVLLACEKKQLVENGKFPFRALASAKVAEADDGMHWLTVTAECGGETVIFRDFASIGKFGGYYTWFAMEGLPAVTHAEKGNPPIWCNR